MNWLVTACGLGRCRVAPAGPGRRSPASRRGS